MSRGTRILNVVACCVLLLGTALGLVACEPSAREREEYATMQNQKALIAATPLPKLTRSQARINLAKRLERINQENVPVYIYLTSQTGKIMATFVADGMPQSLNSYLTPFQDIHGRDIPDLDGAYGENPDGSFFFTTDGAYVEWSGDYLWSDHPLKLTQQPEFVAIDTTGS